VVIALGRTFSVSKVGRLLREPRRKLHEDIYGKEKLLFMVPEELRPLRKAQIIADYNGEISQSVGSPGNSDASTVEERSIVGATPKAISINNSRNLANEKYQAQDDLAKHAHDAETPKTPEPQRAEDVLSVQLQCSESIQISTSVDRVDKYVNADVMTTVRSEPSPCQLLEKNSTDLMPPPKSHRASLPSMMTSSAPDLSQEIDGARAATILITSARERPPHPNTPKAIPQKRYKGSDSYPPPKRRKVDEHWEVLPFDSEKSTSLSTRSRRAASSTVGITPEHVRGQQLIKGIQRSHKPKNNPEISGSRELPPSSTPLSDLQTESSPYIPENSSASPTKRRASNSKLADRPQNRRRGPRAVAHGMPVAAKGVSANIPPPVFGCLSTSDTVDLPGVSGIVQYTPKGPTEERHNQREPPGTTNFVRGRGMDFGFDGTGGERKPRHRSRGSDGSIQAESSPSTSKKSVSENSDKSNDKLLPQTEDVKMTSASQPAASKKITRIVLVSKNKNGPSITKKINMRPFGASNNETRIDRSQAKATTPTSKKASKTQTSNWVSPNKFVTINHPSQKKRKLELEAQARNANAGPIPKAAESKSCPSPSPETSTSRKPSKSKSTVESTISGVDTLVMNAKSAPNSGFMISTTSTRSRSNETQSKNTALPKSSNVTVQSRPGAMEKVFSKPTRTRNATGVGARELQSLLEPHKPSMGVDSSFGDSFTQPRGAARPSRNPSDKLQIPQTQIQSDTGVTDQGDPKLTLVDPISLEATVEGSILTVKRRMSNVKEFKTSPQEQATPTKASPDSTLHAPTSTKEIGNNSERSPLMTRPSDTVAIQSIATSRRQSRSYSQNPQNMKKPSPGSSLAANEVIEQQIVEQEPTGVLQAGSIGRPLNTTLLEEIRLSSTPSRRRSSVGTNPLIIPTPTAMPVGKGPITDLKAEAKKEVVETPSPVAASDSLVPPSPTWKPNELSQDSVLTYAGGEAWPGLSVYPSSGNVCRSIRAEREGVFRASGVLMGVRFVIGL
jgi:hypothetical protein